MKLAIFLKRMLGINEYPSVDSTSVDEVAEQAARARVRLGKAIDQWSREEVKRSARYFPMSDYVRGKDPRDG